MAIRAYRTQTWSGLVAIVTKLHDKFGDNYFPSVLCEEDGKSLSISILEKATEREVRFVTFEDQIDKDISMVLQIFNNHTTEKSLYGYGFCPMPRCNAPGVTRERRPNGNDTCANGHTYPSRDAKGVISDD